MDEFYPKKNGLAVLCTKNPSIILIETVNGIRTLYPEFDIIIIDSDSTDKQYFEFIPSDVKIHYIKNKKWELGAWTYAFEKYSDYKVYMFLQDNITPIERIPNFDMDNFTDGTMYSFHYHARIYEGGYFDVLCELYKDTNLDFLYNIDPNTPLIGTAHTSFITNNENVLTILQLEYAYIIKNINEKTKIDSWLSERLGGYLSSLHGNIRIDISPYFKKQCGGRD